MANYDLPLSPENKTMVLISMPFPQKNEIFSTRFSFIFGALIFE